MRRRRGLGLTLAETIVAMGVLGVLGVVLVQIYGVAHRAYAVNMGRMDVQQRARFALQHITPLVYAAIPLPSSALAVSSPAVGARPTSKLVFNVADQPATPRHPTYHLERIWLEPPDTKVEGGRLWVRSLGRILADRNTEADTGDDRVLAREVGSLDFQVVSDSAVRVTVEAWVPMVAQDSSRTWLREDQFHKCRLQTVVQLPFKAMR